MQVFTIAPAGARPMWVLVPIVLTLAVVVTVLALSLLGARSARFEVSAEGLRIRGDLYGRLVPAGQLHADRARRVDADTDPALRPVRRNLGTALPGYRAGWFRLADGARALVYVTDARKAVHVPTALGYDLLLSPDDPDEFLTALRAIPLAGAPKRP